MFWEWSESMWVHHNQSGFEARFPHFVRFISVIDSRFFPLIVIHNSIIVFTFALSIKRFNLKHFIKNLYRCVRFFFHANIYQKSAIRDKIISSIMFIVVRLCVFPIEVNKSFNWYKINVNCYSIGAICPVGVSEFSFLRVPFPKESAWQIVFVHFSARWCLDITYLSFYNKPLWVPGFLGMGEPERDTPGVQSPVPINSDLD
jgi:hypothetical protein